MNTSTLRIIVVRPGAAVGAADDELRTLTPYGIESVHHLAERITPELSARRTQVLVSPAQRAHHTGIILSPAGGAGVSVLRELYLPEGADRAAIDHWRSRHIREPLRMILEEIPGALYRWAIPATQAIYRTLGRDTQAVLIVTHNPLVALIGMGMNPIKAERILNIGLGEAEAFLLEGERFELLKRS